MRARYLPPVVLNLIIINCIFFFCTFIFREKNFGFSMDNFFDLHYPGTTYFMPHQFITYGFMHADIFHLFFNMLAIIMFAPMIEIVWRPKRFLTFYILCILGSSVFTTGMYYFEIKQEQNRI